MDKTSKQVFVFCTYHTVNPKNDLVTNWFEEKYMMTFTLLAMEKPFEKFFFFALSFKL